MLFYGEIEALIARLYLITELVIFFFVDFIVMFIIDAVIVIIV